MTDLPPAAAPDSLDDPRLAAAVAAQRAGNFAQAESIYRTLLETQPRNANLLHLYGLALHQLQRSAEAVPWLERAIAIHPNVAIFHANLGTVLMSASRLKDAEKSFARAIDLDPTLLHPHEPLGVLLANRHHYGAAALCFRKALQLEAANAALYHNLGIASLAMGDIRTAMASLKQGLALAPFDAAIQSSYLSCLPYIPDMSPDALLEETRRITANYRTVMPPSAPRLPVTSPAGKRHIAFVSPHFQQHSIAFFLLPLLESLRNFTVTLYSNSPREDATTLRLHAAADHWHNIHSLSDDAAAALIREHSVDLLMDLAGHSPNNRLGVFARKPAPVQATFLGYPHTTGLSQIDFRITDSLADPIGQAESAYAERVLRLPRTAWCFKPPASVTEQLQTPRPSRANGPIAFACFAPLAKINPPLMALWAQILTQVPHAKLLLKNAALADPALRLGIAKSFERLGIPPDRIVLQPWRATYAEHLADYLHADIALDTFPYNSASATCEALLMGVPVITLAGKLHPARIGVSLLTNAGLAELIAKTPEDYVARAVTLASAPAKLAQYHTTLREKMQASPLMDAPAYAAAFEQAVQFMLK